MGASRGSSAADRPGEEKQLSGAQAGSPMQRSTSTKKSGAREAAEAAGRSEGSKADAAGREGRSIARRGLAVHSLASTAPCAPLPCPDADTRTPARVLRARKKRDESSVNANGLCAARRRRRRSGEERRTFSLLRRESGRQDDLVLDVEVAVTRQVVDRHALAVDHVDEACLPRERQLERLDMQNGSERSREKCTHRAE